MLSTLAARSALFPRTKPTVSRWRPTFRDHRLQAAKIIIAATPSEFCRAIKSHLAATLNRCIELNVGCIFQHLRYYAFPFSDIGFDHVCDRSAFVIEVATEDYLISDLKLRGIDTPDFCLGINPENPGEQLIFDGNGIRRTRNHCS